MIAGIIDTNILIEIYRGNTTAKTWFASHGDLAITSITWLEFMEGARGKAGQNECLKIMSSLELIDLISEDQRWARDKLLSFRLSHGVSFADCLIASVCHRLQVPLYTQNIKDFQPLLDATLITKPY